MAKADLRAFWFGSVLLEVSVQNGARSKLIFGSNVKIDLNTTMWSTKLIEFACLQIFQSTFSIHR